MSDDRNDNLVAEPSSSYKTPYTYTDYLQEGVDEVFEVIRGIVLQMSPGANSHHQEIQLKLSVALYHYFKGKSCKVFTPDFDVVLPIRNETKDTATTIVQPDLCVICDRKKVHYRACIGPPDLVVEIISPFNIKRDVRDKFSIYEEVGIKEFWIVFPDRLEQFVLEGKYKLKGYHANDAIVESVIFPELKVDLKEIFDFEGQWKNEGGQGDRVEEPAAPYHPKPYTYADYLQAGVDEIFEVIRGKVMEMSPGASSEHQRIQMRLSGELYPIFKGKTCEIFGPPFDVVLPVRNETRETATTIVQPDLCIICDPLKIDKGGCIGPPDLVMEIVSPSNSKRVIKEKFSIYQEAGVREYWIVFPKEQSMEIFVLENDKYEKHHHYFIDDEIRSFIFPNIVLKGKDIFKKSF